MKLFRGNKCIASIELSLSVSLKKSIPVTEFLNKDPEIEKKVFKPQFF